MALKYYRQQLAMHPSKDSTEILALSEALEEHAEAITRAAAASDKYAMWIAITTIALVFSTLALVWATLRIGG